ncbi:MAG: hypothetical protein ABH879_10820 [archaeon]
MVGVDAKCRVCGKNHPVSSFVLDTKYMMMVCAECSKKARQSKEARKPKEASDDVNVRVVGSQKPAGWDAEDEYLAKVQKQKKRPGEETPVIRVDMERVKYRCPKCNYEFLYNIVRKHPGVCPYCAREIGRVRVQ